MTYSEAYALCNLLRPWQEDGAQGHVDAEGRYPEAEKLYRECFDVQRRVLGPDHPDTLWSMTYQANSMEAQGNYSDAEKLQRATIDIKRQVLGPEHLGTLDSISSLARTLTKAGRYDEAEKLQRQTLDVERRVFGQEYPATVTSLQWEGIDLSHLGKFTEAQKLFDEAIQAAVKATQSSTLAGVWYNYACAAAIAGHRDQALSLLRQAIEHGLDSGTASSIEADPDLKPLHGGHRFEALVATAHHRSAEKVH